MPLISRLGAASSRGFGEFAQQTAANYIEDVFSTYLYTGNGSTQTITNGIDLAGKGGLVWMKGRSGATDNALYDTARGATFELVSNSTAAQTTQTTGLTGFSASGFSIGALAKINTSAATYVSWTFREQPKFFDIVTYTGNATAGRTISHNLGSVPGMMIIKRTDGVTNWPVYHRSMANNEYVFLNATNAKASVQNYWNSTTPTSTVFTLGSDANVNASGGTYVAYLFAHDAGGFGADGSQNVISCGSYTGNGSNTGPVITLGYEPQFVLVKSSSNSLNWHIVDVMRGMTVDQGCTFLYPNLTNADGVTGISIAPTPTGFQVNTVSTSVNTSGATYIYMAIRRGPMRTPTSGTSVFSPVKTTASSGTLITTGFPVDLQFQRKQYTVNSLYTLKAVDRLRGISSTSAESGPYLQTSTTAAEIADSTTRGMNNVGYQISSYNNSDAQIYWNLARAPGFFDVVCSSSFVNGTPLNHNLGVVPELIISKARNDGAGNWMGAYKDGASVKNISLNVTTGAYDPSQTWSSLFTSTTFDPNGIKNAAGGGVKGSASSTVSYLFATCPGVSKVGSYTGTGTTKQIDCGFTAGARFVLIKRTDSTGDWYVYDSARGIIAGNDPYLFLNSAAAEVTSTDYVDTYAAGFELSSTAPAGLNANGGTYIFLAIA